MRKLTLALGLTVALSSACHAQLAEEFMAVKDGRVYRLKVRGTALVGREDAPLEALLSAVEAVPRPSAAPAGQLKGAGASEATATSGRGQASEAGDIRDYSWTVGNGFRFPAHPGMAVGQRLGLYSTGTTGADPMTLCGWCVVKGVRNGKAEAHVGEADGCLMGSFPRGRCPGTVKYVLSTLNHTPLPQAQYEELINGKLWLGMSFAHLLCSWGSPRDINRTVGAFGVQEQWVYGAFPRCTYVYIENGKVASWQN